LRRLACSTSSFNTSNNSLAATRSPESNSIRVISPLVSEVSSTPLTARMVPTASSVSSQASMVAGDAAIVTGGGVKSILAKALKRLYRYPPIDPKMSSSRTMAMT
jgi:hypothetical protein